MVGFLINKLKKNSLQQKESKEPGFQLLSILSCFLILASFLVFPIKEVVAKDLDNGKELFEANCNACHINGKNKIIPEKNLQRATLEMNGILNKEAIVYQITNGKNGMPAFGGRLKQSEINDIASYVLHQFQ